MINLLPFPTLIQDEDSPKSQAASQICVDFYRVERKHQ